MTPEDLQRLARLSRLDLPAQEAARLRPALESILSWVASLQEAPTDGVAPMAHPNDLPVTLRPDEVQALPERDRLMANAPAQAVGHFLVPRVVE